VFFLKKHRSYQLYNFYNNLLNKSTDKKQYRQPAAVDGSHYSLDKSLMRDNIPSYNKGKTTQLTIITILKEDNKLPVYINEDTNNNEVQVELCFYVKHRS
jgi:hypothetical protein